MSYANLIEEAERERIRLGVSQYNLGQRLLAALKDTIARAEKAEAENNHLRASTANNGGPCLYCALPKEEWAKCRHGFPGCDRADDAMLCPNVGASLDYEAERDKWRELAREAVHAAGWLVKCDDHRPLFAGMTPEGWLVRFRELEG